MDYRKYGDTVYIRMNSENFITIRTHCFHLKITNSTVLQPDILNRSRFPILRRLS